MAVFEPLFAHYLEEEKHIRLAGLRESKGDGEVQSRWRRFVERWNRRGLDDSWYEPQMFLRVVRSGAGGGRAAETLGDNVSSHAGGSDGGSDGDSDSEEDGYGPALPPPAAATKSARLAAGLGPGPAIPSLADLEERRTLDSEERDAARAALRLARKADRTEQRERLDDLVPRAAAGTRERQLEKKRMLNEKMQGFRDKSPGGEVDDSELMGDGGDSGGIGGRGAGGSGSVAEYKQMLATMQRKRTDWEVRREEEQRARDAELSERREQYRAREAETIEMLRGLARQRFG